MIQQQPMSFSKKNDWPTGLAKHVRKYHEQLIARGLTPDEVHWYKSRGRWIKGQVAESKTVELKNE